MTHPNKGKIPWNKGLKGAQVVSAETRAKLSLVRLGNKNAKGTKRSEEFKRERSRMMRAMYAEGILKNERGERAKNWRGGKTSLDKIARTSARYKYWRTKVFERDDYTCQGCGKKGCYLEAHHILSWAKFPDHRFLLSNGLSLCAECHKKTDTYAGKGIKKYAIRNNHSDTEGRES